MDTPAVESLDPPADLGGADGLSSPRGDAGADEDSPPAFGGESGLDDEGEEAPPSGFGLPLPISMPGMESPPADFAGDNVLASLGGDPGAKPGGESGFGGELLPLSPPLGFGGNEELPLPISMPGGIALPAESGFGAPSGFGSVSPPGMPGDLAEPFLYKSLRWTRKDSGTKLTILSLAAMPFPLFSSFTSMTFGSACTRKPLG